MIKIKSKREIELMREAGKILAEGKMIVRSLVRPGISTNFLNKKFEEFVKSKNAIPSFKNYGGFPKSICASNNDELIHGIPNDEILKDGDLLSIDAGVEYKGYHSDSAFTVSVGNSTNENDLLIKVAKEAFWAGVDQVKPGNRVGDISFAIYEVIKKYNMHTPKDFTGHGIGSSLHEEPYVPNQAEKNSGPLLREGMVICIEPMILQNSKDYIIQDDQWTICSTDGSKASHYEHTILITKTGYELLTEEKNG
ncbi:MAG: type I methionyl aminopeptidase [Mycoplasma sp.]|nr:type I methionyl aminopeptidase [Mycoplasma sp.]